MQWHWKNQHMQHVERKRLVVCISTSRWQQDWILKERISWRWISYCFENKKHIENRTAAFLLVPVKVCKLLWQENMDGCGWHSQTHGSITSLTRMLRIKASPANKLTKHVWIEFGFEEATTSKKDVIRKQEEEGWKNLIKFHASHFHFINVLPHMRLRGCCYFCTAEIS